MGIENQINREIFSTEIARTYLNPSQKENDIMFGYFKELTETLEWMKEKGYEREADKMIRKHNKLESGGNIMWHNIEIPKDYIGAFVGHRPTCLTHPDEDRFLTIRECLSIMKLPNDFILQGGRKNLNHICQNVPVTTAQDMAENVVAFVEGRLDNQLMMQDYVIQDNKNRRILNENSSVQLDEFMV